MSVTALRSCLRWTASSHGRKANLWCHSKQHQCPQQHLLTQHRVTQLRRINTDVTAAGPSAPSAISPQEAADLYNALSPEAQVSIRNAVVASLAHQDRYGTSFSSIDLNQDGVIEKGEYQVFKEAQKASDTREVTIRELRLVFLRSLVPMIGFGFLDNFIMLTAGDAIDNTLGETLRISTLAAAGLGNLCSDVAGLGLSNTIEAGAEKLGLPCPKLTLAQMATAKVRRAVSLGSIIGISIGCLLGMLPLLLMDTTHKDLHTLFKELDKNGNGVLDYSEVLLAFDRLDLNISDADALKVLEKITGKPNAELTFKEFCKVVEHFNNKDKPWWMFW